MAIFLRKPDWIGQSGSIAEEARDAALRETLPGISARARSLLLQRLQQSDFDGTLSAEDASAIASADCKTISGLMLELLPLAASFARPAISNFPVGALIRGASGRLYFGANIEFSGKALSDTVHAEQSAAANAFMHREEDIIEIAVTAAPCGMCRQFLWEMCYERGLSVLTRAHAPVALTSLLPDAFGPGHLGRPRGAFPVVTKAINLPPMNEVAMAALEAAQMSYAPYTRAYAGVAIRTAQGRIHRGGYIENAAYNPSLPPFQVALASLIVAGDDPSLIVETCLVEVAGRPLCHKMDTEAALGLIAPSAVFTAFSALEDEQAAHL